MKVVKTIRESENYALCVASAFDNDGGETDRLVYAVINREHGVTEAEAHVLAQALAYQDQLEGALVEYQSDRAEREATVPGSISLVGPDGYNH